MTNARLLAMSGALKGTVWPVKDGPLLLGRDASSQVRTSDAAVSRKHCSVTEAAGGGFEIEDLNSHNGTFVNGTKVSRQAIQHGDRIRIGGSEFVFLTGPDNDDTGTFAAKSGTDSALKTLQLDYSALPSDASWVGRMARDLSAF
ncbi:MAG TPA: FHA domain-containing protein, partial [Acidobacteriaceae bacterium]|nr:FHA domain-containing protein [Acidobacteriaceae bacterium]